MTPNTVLDYWFGDGLVTGWPTQPMGDVWFGGGAVIDQEIRTRFGSLVEAAVGGGLSDWEPPLLHRLALVVLLDQFTRNVFRGQAKAFAGDPRARALAGRTLAQGEDAALPLVGRVFMAMPLMHAEDLASQTDCVRHFENLLAIADPAHAPHLEKNLASAREHRDIVAAYGRFPHRNAALGRTSTAGELAYLQTGKRFSQ
jgi:uncharacterized protein (DUF924 family)